MKKIRLHPRELLNDRPIAASFGLIGVSWLAALLLSLAHGLGRLALKLPLTEDTGTLWEFVPEIVGIAWPVALAVYLGYGHIFRQRGFLRTLGLGWFALLVGVFSLTSAFGILPADAPWKGLRSTLLGLVTLFGVGLREETVFRGLMAGALGAKYGGTRRGWLRAALLSGALFAWVHLLNLLSGISAEAMAVQFIGTFTFGMMLSALYWRGGSLWALVFLHFLRNARLLLTLYIFRTDTVTAVDALNQMNWLALLPAAIEVAVALALLRRLGGKQTQGTAVESAEAIAAESAEAEGAGAEPAEAEASPADADADAREAADPNTALIRGSDPGGKGQAQPEAPDTADDRFSGRSHSFISAVFAVMVTATLLLLLIAATKDRPATKPSAQSTAPPVTVVYASPGAADDFARQAEAAYRERHQGDKGYLSALLLDIAQAGEIRIGIFAMDKTGGWELHCILLPGEDQPDTSAAGERELYGSLRSLSPLSALSSLSADRCTTIDFPIPGTSLLLRIREYVDFDSPLLRQAAACPETVHLVFWRMSDGGERYLSWEVVEEDAGG
ncbi:MAG: CPBP family intramembrane metalloprotease [Clostridia bacterium]|nr:CPBP family intramembrane metalloprotease [Clostridia bacterium]